MCISNPVFQYKSQCFPSFGKNLSLKFNKATFKGIVIFKCLKDSIFILATNPNTHVEDTCKLPRKSKGKKKAVSYLNHMLDTFSIKLPSSVLRQDTQLSLGVVAFSSAIL